MQNHEKKRILCTPRVIPSEKFSFVYGMRQISVYIL